ncbi:MAG: bifunctional chorismate mutase/prephenate dehydratase [Ruminococcaceae bacterium]|nr:bifunctional chorismate mutase/prephenate dehydratase [Oscillospiraceae bacterium]
MNLEEYRKQIDVVDDEIVRLFQERMDIAAKIAAYKKEQGIAILQPARERAKLAEISEKSREDMQSYMRVLYSLLFELSRTYQEKGNRTELFYKIEDAIEHTPRLFPQSATVACQGVEGAYSQIACEKLFKNPQIQYFRNFEGIFAAIESGFCQYGILPIENSTAGSVKKVYDLMIKHNFSIVRSTRMKVDHCLLARSSHSEIKEIFSHEQAIAQCAGFLKSLGNVKVTVCENTAVAAQLVAQSERTDIAALSSRYCAELYNLRILKNAVQDGGNNHTRFLCISKNTQIFPGADKTSIMMVLPHKPGALYKVLARLYALDINLLKLESRPLPERDFEFMFYLDLETSVYSDEFVQLMCEIGGICEEFKYLGSYSEVV